MFETVTSLEGASQVKNDTAEIVLARVIRLRKGESILVPSTIVVNIEAKRGSENLSVFGQADLRDGTSHVLLPGKVWDCLEDIATQLPGESLDPALPEVLSGKLESIIAQVGEGLDDKALLVFTLVVRAFRAALASLLRACQPSVPVAPASSTAFSNDQVGGNVVSGITTGIHGFYEAYFNRISKYAVAPAPDAPVYNGEAANVFPDAPYIDPLPKDGTKGFLLEREALRYGMSSTRFPNGAFVVEDAQGNRLAFKWGRSPLASGLALSICSYKEATRKLLERVNIPVPKGRVFSILDRENAIEYANRIGYPVVCKPVAGLRGIGVVSNIQNQKELVHALDLYEQSEMGSDDFVIEEHVPGEDYRIVIIGDEVVASVVRAPASVVGDGLHTILDLIEYKNRARKENPHLSSRPIRTGEALEYQLTLAGLTYSSVPAKGQQVILANSANLSQGGDSFEIADEMHPSIKELAVRAVKAVPGLGFCGLDMLIEDHRKPVSAQRVTVIELNAHAAIGSAQYPMWGTPAPVAQRFFEETAKSAGVELPEKRATELSLKINIRGTVTRVSYRRWFRKHAKAFGLNGYIKNIGDRQVEAYVRGPADGVAAIAYLAIEGPERAVPSSVTVTQAEFEDVEGFRIKNNSKSRKERSNR